MIRRIADKVALAGLLVVAAAWFVFLRPVSMGGSATWIIVRGDSMLPTYQTGDLIVFRAASDYRVGDAIAYRVPAGELGAGRVIMHRIVGGDGVSGFIVQGDNNPVPDPWHPLLSDVEGAVWLVGPQLGRPIAILHQPLVAAALAASVIVAVMLGRTGPEARPTTPPRSRRLRGLGRRGLPGARDDALDGSAVGAPEPGPDAISETLGRRSSIEPI